MASSQQQQSFSMKMVTYGIQKKFPAVKHISCEEFQKMMTDDSSSMTVLDCRDVQENAVSYINGGIVVDYECVDPWKNIDFSSSKIVVCYCSVGYRSSIVADKLKRHFQSQKREDILIYNLEGGIFQWAMEARDLNGQHKDCVHPYSTFWGKLLPHNLRHSNL